MTGNQENLNKKHVEVHIDEELKELIPGYLKNRHKDIESITEALKNDDFSTIQTLGHSMKGSGGGYGFDLISEIGKKLEQAAKDKSRETITACLTELKDYLDHLEIVYE